MRTDPAPGEQWVGQGPLKVANRSASSKITSRPICSTPGTTVTGGAPPRSSAVRRGRRSGGRGAHSPRRDPPRLAKDPGLLDEPVRVRKQLRGRRYEQFFDPRDLNDLCV